ncbi:hypothetical protein HanPI659440_Chr14g0553211 [Helianthus annuus]|nr:hypothetical protein HanPI659440_Chr14g0553211 [Helianthus annuus]
MRVMTTPYSLNFVWLYLLRPVVKHCGPIDADGLRHTKSLSNMCLYAIVIKSERFLRLGDFLGRSAFNALLLPR